MYVPTLGGLDRCWDGEPYSWSVARVARQNNGLVDEIRCCFGLQQEECELLADPSESGGRWRVTQQVDVF